MDFKSENFVGSIPAKSVTNQTIHTYTRTYTHVRTCTHNSLCSNLTPGAAKV